MLAHDTWNAFAGSPWSSRIICARWTANNMFQSTAAATYVNLNGKKAKWVSWKLQPYPGTFNWIMWNRVNLGWMSFLLLWAKLVFSNSGKKWLWGYVIRLFFFSSDVTLTGCQGAATPASWHRNKAAGCVSKRKACTTATKQTLCIQDVKPIETVTVRNTSWRDT